jgi:hypothetical protein
MINFGLINAKNQLNHHNIGSRKNYEIFTVPNLFIFKKHIITAYKTRLRGTENGRRGQKES